MTKSIREVGNIRLALSEWQSEVSAIFSQSARLMTEIVHAQLIHFKNDEIILFVSDDCEKYRVGIPMIGNLSLGNVETFDLQASSVESCEFELAKLHEHKLIKNLYDDLGISNEYFIRICSNHGKYQLFYEKYLIQ